MPPVPKVKVPPEYTEAATKLASEGGTMFDKALNDFAGELSSNIESRTAPLAGDAMDTVKAAGVFDKPTDGPATHLVGNQSDFEVAMDSFLGKTSGTPKEVTGTGRMEGVPNAEFPRLTDDYKPGTGVLMDRGIYSPLRRNPKTSNYPLNSSEGRDVVDSLHTQNRQINENISNRELANPDEPRLFANNPNPDRSFWNQGLENIPAVAGGAIGAGVLLSSQNAEAKKSDFDTMSLDTGSDGFSGKQAELPQPLSAKTKAPISLMAQIMPSESQKMKDTAQQAADAVISGEIQNLKNAVIEGTLSIANPIVAAYNGYQAERAARKAKLAEIVAGMDLSTLSENEKELALTVIGSFDKNASPVDAAIDTTSMMASGAGLAHDEVKRFTNNVIIPVRAAVQASNRANDSKMLQVIRDKAPSLAILGETAMWPVYGNTGFNLGDKGADTDPETLDPVAQKIINDKSYFIGREGGAAMLSIATAYRDLPLWLVGGSSKLGLALGGMANELYKDDPDLVRGAGIGVGAGTVFQGLASTKIAQEAVDLLAKIKFKPNTGMYKEGLNAAGERISLMDNPATIKEMWNALRGNTIEPLAIMTDNIATKMADDAAAKADSMATNAFKTQKVGPQAILLDVSEDGAPKVYGVKDGTYGELHESHPNIEGRPVLLTTNAKDVWVDNTTLRDTFARMTKANRTPATVRNGIDEWTNALIPPENPSLVFAWKNGGDEGGMMEIYRAGSHKFNADLLRSRNLVSVEYDGPNGETKTGLGFYSEGGYVIAPDASENIPGAIPHDLVFKRKALDKSIPVGPVDAPKIAWSVNPIRDDDTLYNIVDHIKGHNDSTILADAEVRRGNMFTDGIPLKPQPAPFDNLPDQPGDLGGTAPDSKTEVNFNFLPTAGMMDVAKSLNKLAQKGATSYNNALGKASIASTTTYGEKFKIDASIEAFSWRHFKRYFSDMEQQLNKTMTGLHPTIQEDIRQYISGNRSTPPAGIAADIQTKVNQYVTERNADYALIKQLNGSISNPSPTGVTNTANQGGLNLGATAGTKPAPLTSPIGPNNPGQTSMIGQQTSTVQTPYNGAVNVQNSLFNTPVSPKNVASNHELERTYALDYVSAEDWINRLEKSGPVPESGKQLITLVKKNPNAVDRSKYNTLLGKQNLQSDMAKDYMNRKRQISTLLVMQELANNPSAASNAFNDALGHTIMVNTKNGGELNGKFVSKETYDAIFTLPAQQEMVRSNLLKAIDMVKFNKTVLNPGTWVKNTMGNVWGVMNSNIVPTYAMATRMPRGFSVMNKDLAAYSKDITSGAPSVKRVHETLKYGLLGAEFEGVKNQMGEVLDKLEIPKGKTHFDNVSDIYYHTKDKTLTALGNAYSKIDMATKYSLYVNGLERWGIDLSTNELDKAAGRFKAGDLLGHSIAKNPALSDFELSDMIKREVVRRIHLSLPMVDRTSTAITGLSKMAGITNPWLRTALDLARVTAQMPYRAVNEKGYAANALMTGVSMFDIYFMNKMMRRENGISDQNVEDAMTIAPENVKKFMPGAAATPVRASDGGIVFVDTADMLIEPLQWFGGNDQHGMGKRVVRKLIDTVVGGGFAENEIKSALADYDLTEEPQTFNKPIWKQGDWKRSGMDALTRFGPQIINNGYNLYSAANLPKGMAMKGQEKLQQPFEMQVLKTLGIDVASLGTKEQKQYKLAEINSERKAIVGQIKSNERQTPGSSTGVLQPTYDNSTVRSILQKKLDDLDKKEINLMKAKPTPKKKL